MLGDAQEKEPVEDRPQLPDGVIHVALPPGELHIENISRFGKPLIRLSVDKTVIEAQTMFFGDSKGATKYESTKEGIHWAPASGGKGFIFANGGVSVRKPGSTIGDPDFYALNRLKAGNVFLSTPSVRFVFGAEAKVRPVGREGPVDTKPNAQDGPNLPDGVIHVRLPDGQVRIETSVGVKPIYRVSAGKTVIETRTFFFGDGRGAGSWDATKEGSGNSYIHNPGSSINYQQFLPVEKLKAGSIYVTTPSIIFKWGIIARPKR
jgi:hypothetical protein